MPGIALTLRSALCAAALPCLLACSAEAVAEPLGVAPTYAGRQLSKVPNEAAITRRIWVPGLDDGFVPQGLSIAAGALYVSGYFSRDKTQGRGPCRLYRLDMATGRTTGSLDLPARCGHAGGLARGPAGRLYLADTRALYEIALAGGNEPGIGRVLRTIGLAGDVKGSFAAGSADAVWLGTYAREPGARLYRIPFAKLGAEAGLSDAVHAVPLPARAQGAAFDAAGRLWITRSSGKLGELVRLDPVTGAVEARFAMPVGVEDLSFDGSGRLWTLSEAGSRRWLDWPTFFPLVFAIDTAKLR
jgi:sugar lactone lactonase YvrE